MYTIHIFIYIHYIVQLSNMLQFFNRVLECPQNWSVCGLKWVSGCSLHSTQPLLTCTLCPVSVTDQPFISSRSCDWRLLSLPSSLWVAWRLLLPNPLQVQGQRGWCTNPLWNTGTEHCCCFFTFSFFVECLDNVTEERGSVASNKKDCLYQYSNIWYGNN